jgi:hypothetical protein
LHLGSKECNNASFFYDRMELGVVEFGAGISAQARDCFVDGDVREVLLVEFRAGI